jgi:signal transduction histidine kinase
LRAYYFLEEHIPAQQKPFIRQVLTEQGGVRLYHNGFRVLPYGEQGDDWLGLDYSDTKRSVLAPHKNRNFFGFIDVTDSQSVPILEETSSREGVIATKAFEELARFGYEALSRCAMRVAELRGRKPTTTTSRSTGKSRREVVARNATDLLAMLHRGTDFNKDEVGVLKKLAEEIIVVNAAGAQDEQRMVEELEMLRVLASLGLVIGMFTHEVRHDLVALRADLSILARNELKDDAREGLVTRIRANFDSLSNFAGYFDDSVSANIRRELAPQDLRKMIGRFAATVRPRSIRSKISLETVLLGSKLTTLPMHPSEVHSILFNLYTNSEKAIRRANVAGRISILADRSDSKVRIRFCDNGIGVPEGHRERIFDAFFSTASSATEAGDIVVGTGLGLKIVHDMVTSRGGRIWVGSPPSGFSTNIQFELPAEQEQTDA